MKKHLLPSAALALFLLLGLVFAGPLQAAEQSKSPPPADVSATPLTPGQEKAVEDIVRRYIMDNPEIIVDAVRAMRERQEMTEKAHARAQLAQLKERIVNDPLTPVGGNPKGDVTVVEFFDYRCGYCKRAYPSIKQLLAEDTGIRYLFKEFPILGDESVFASRAATAAWIFAPAKYGRYHDALMATRGALPAEKVMKIAADVGLDTAALRRGMDDPRVDQALQTNAEIARAIGVNGTPAFIFGDELVPGAIDLAAMKQLVAQARGS